MAGRMNLCLFRSEYLKCKCDRRTDRRTDSKMHSPDKECVSRRFYACTSFLWGSSNSYQTLKQRHTRPIQMAAFLIGQLNRDGDNHV